MNGGTLGCAVLELIIIKQASFENSVRLSNFALNYEKMKNWICTLCCAMCILLLTGCSGYNNILKSTDYLSKYELGKAMYVEGKYNTASDIIEECVMMFRGTPRAEESVYILADCYYKMEDWVMAAEYFRTYYQSFPKGVYAEDARFLAGLCLFRDTPDPRLDQSSTYGAITELQSYLEAYPYSTHLEEANDMIYAMYDRLVEKEMKSAKLYYEMGNFMGNNYRSGIITAQNALKDFPYTKYREDLSMLILRCKYRMAVESVEDKMLDRYRDTIDEYYAFKNEFPDSKYMKEVEKIYSASVKHVGNYQ